jgi:type IV secretion system protein VirB8
MNQQPPHTQTPPSVDQMLNDPTVVNNPYSRYGVRMTYAQKRKFRKQIKLQLQPKSWFQDKYQFVLVQRNFLALITLVSLLGSVVTGYAVLSLTPLKTVEPFVIQIEERSGITQLVEPMDREKLGGKEALDNYFLWQYVRARETYHPADQRRNWEITRVMSNAEVFSKFLEDSSPSNPKSARSILGALGTRTISEPTFVYLNDPEKNVVQVRFVVEENFKQAKTRYPKIATITYDFFNLELTRAQRMLNPLGFQVTSYRLDEEVVK